MEKKERSAYGSRSSDVQKHPMGNIFRGDGSRPSLLLEELI